MAALDRLATLLWLAAAHEIHTKADGTSHFPSFRSVWLTRLQNTYGEAKAWPDLLALLEAPMFRFVKQFR
jgi:hypothetical protein